MGKIKNQGGFKKMKRFLGFVGILGVLVGMVTIVEAADLYVPGSYTTIQAAIDAATTGDVVLVASGIYIGTGNKNLTWSGKHIVVKFEKNSSADCIIDCQGSGRGFYFNGTGQDSRDVIDGFTIRNGDGGDNGGGIYCSDASPSITNCVIVGNTAYDGGAIFCYNSSPLITNCVITKNTAVHGGGIFCNRWLPYECSPSITNCVITENTANGGGGISSYGNSSPLIDYNNFWGNSAPYGPNYYGCSAGPHDISINPQFIGGGNYHLQGISPCINTGSNTAPAIPPTDKDGNPRIYNNYIVDMGAYEYQGTPTTAYIIINPTAGTVGSIIFVTGSGFGSTESIRIDFGTTRTIAMVITTASGSFTAAFTVDTQPYGSTTVRAMGLGSGKTADAVFRILPIITYINPAQGIVGTIVTVAGNGYAPSEMVIIGFGTTPSITAVNTTSYGNFATTFTVNTQSYGTKTISAYGLTSGAVAWNIFFMRANIILLTPTMGTVGSIVMVRGNGFGANERIRINFGTIRTIQLTSAYAEGSFTTAFTINTQPYGYTTIVAIGIIFNTEACATFVIMPKVIMLTPSWGTVGSIVFVKGNGFGASESIQIDFGTTRTILITRTYAEGSFTTAFTVDTQPFGTTTIRVIGFQTATQDMNYFFIQPNIILVSPCAGTVGSSVTIAGNGFGKAENIRVDFGAKLNIGEVISSTFGTFSALFAVDTQPYGITTIAARGLVTGSMVMAQFTIVPKIVISPTAGQIGCVVSVAGNGFGASELIRIEFGTIRTITFASTTAMGGFGVIFTVNTQPMGTTTIVACSLASQIYVMAHFVILPSTQITVFPSAGTVGSIIIVGGGGFSGNELIQVSFGRCLTITTVSTNASGSFTTAFTVDTQSYGSTTVRARGITSGKSADAVFRILPIITYINPAQGTVGTIVTVSGNGYLSTEAVMISFGTTRTIQITLTTAAGNFATTFTVDTQSYGTKTISACGLTSDTVDCDIFFMRANIILVTPTYGTVGSFVTIRGNGFGAPETIQIDFGTTANIQQISSSVYGSFTTCFTINTQPCGITTILARGVNSGGWGYANFNIRSSVIFISPWMGTVGTTVTVMGNGFGASELIKIDFGNTPTITTDITDAGGRFNTTFWVNTQPYGTTTIRVVGLQTQEQAMMCFFIVPNIILVTPYIGTVGSSVTIAGNGFGKMEYIRVDFGTTMPICISMSSYDGTFSALFAVDLQPYGITTIAARGLVTGSQVLAQFTIIPKIVISPTAGQIGSKVTVAGNGFGATELIRIAFGTTRTMTTVITYATGEFAAIFTVDSQPMGTTTIGVYGSGIYAQAYFVIMPATILKITPAVGNIAVGSTFTCSVEIINVSQLVASDIYIGYNPDVLEAIGVGTGTFPPGSNAVSTVTVGNISYSFGLFSGDASGSGTLCYLYFRAKSGGTSAVTINNPTQLLKVINEQAVEISFTKEEAIYYVIGKIKVKPENTTIKADVPVVYQSIAECGGELEIDVTSSTMFSSNGGGSFTSNTFLPKNMGTYTIQGTYLGFVGTTSVIIIPGTPTTLQYVSGNDQVNTCTLTLKEPFIVKVVDNYGNPCPDVDVHWEIMAVPVGAAGGTITPSCRATNIAGTASSFLTLGTEPPGTYTIHAISTGLSNSPYTFTARSLRRFGTISGYCRLRLGTVTFGTCSDITVSIAGTNTSTTTDIKSYFVFGHFPVGSYTLNFDTWGAASVNLPDICISTTQFEDTTDIGTISLLAGDTNNDGNVNMTDWGMFRPAWREKATVTHTNWNTYKEGDFNHEGKVDAKDFVVFRNNFMKQQQPEGKAKKSMPMSTKAKRTSSGGKIELSFDIDTFEGVNINDLRVGNIIYLKVYLRDAKYSLGGEIHLSFNPDVLEVVNAPIPFGAAPLINRVPAENNKIKVQAGKDYLPNGEEREEFYNEVDNTLGKIDYAVAIFEPDTRDGGEFAVIPFKIKACGASSNVGFDFAPEENRETVFVTQPTTEIIGKPVDVQSEEVIIHVPLQINDLEKVFVYPNPVRKDEVKFKMVPPGELIKLRIFNIAGELVYEGVEQSNGQNEITWKLRNKDNEYVASGIYIYLLEYQGLTKKGKIGVIK